MHKLQTQYENADAKIHWIGKLAHDKHNGEGVELVDLEKIAEILEKYNYGESCGDI